MKKIFTYTTGSDQETKYKLSISAGRGRGIMQWKMQVTSEIQNIHVLHEQMKDIHLLSESKD